MRSQKKQLFVISGLVILVTCILIFAFVFGTRSKKVTSSQETEEIIVFSLDGEIDELQVSGKQSYFIQKGDDGGYCVSEYQAFLNSNIHAAGQQQTVNPKKMEEITKVLSNVTSSTVIENVTDLKQYGLDDALLTVRIKTTGEGKTLHTLEIGDFSEAASMYYARIDENNEVYLITTLIEIALDYSVEDLTKQ